MRTLASLFFTVDATDPKATGGGKFLPLTLALRAPPPIVSHSFAFPCYNLAVPFFLPRLYQRVSVPTSFRPRSSLFFCRHSEEGAGK